MNSIVSTMLALAIVGAFIATVLYSIVQEADGFSTRDIDDAPIAKFGDNVYVVWWSDKMGGMLDVMFRASTDGGETFEDKINLSNTTRAQSLQATVAAAGDNAYVTYLDNKTGNEETYVRTSTDRGQTFGPPIMINGTDTEPRPADVLTQEKLGFDLLEEAPEQSQIAASGNNVYSAVWGKISPTNWEVFFSRSTDEGQTFEDAINLSYTTDSRSDKAILLADDDDVYVTWWETGKNRNSTLSEAVIRVSDDGGETFGPMLKLAANGTLTTGDSDGGGEVTGVSEGLGREGAGEGNTAVDFITYVFSNRPSIIFL